MDLMKPIISAELPTGRDWIYEVKYDGFRCILSWTAGSVQLLSRNGHDLSDQFPEIIEACLRQHSSVREFLPFDMDGELVVLNHRYQANFALIQKRSRLGKSELIEKHAKQRPASFMAFDLLSCADDSLPNQKTFEQRKQKLQTIFASGRLYGQRLQYVTFSKDADRLWQHIVEAKGEGIVAKRRDSLYQSEKSHHDWYKVKNWRTVKAFLTCYNPANDYFTAAVYKDEAVYELGPCKHGLDEETFSALRDLFQSRGTPDKEGYRLPPAICAYIHTLDLLSGQLREPHFSRIVPDEAAASCTWKQLQLDLAMLPAYIHVSNTHKQFWPSLNLTKGDMLAYMREIAPYMLPFLHERLLTMIRCPDGVGGESFFQKHRPDYAPDFLQGVIHRGKTHVVCNDVASLIWLANHGALEYHVPFQTIHHDKPQEIVFDLDPPGREAFSLAVKAANLLKQLLDDLRLTSFVKTSGGKGLQVHIPLPSNSMSYDETATFTQSVALTLEKGYPDLFTTERFKAKRGGRLYIDYLQHDEGKTIVAPYSPRKREDATVAAPLFWDELTEDLQPDKFRVDNTSKRVHELGCPFAAYFAAGEEQMLDNVLKMIRD